MVLELGGNDPLIVLDDADLDTPAHSPCRARIRTPGQRCTAIKRMLVHERSPAISPTSSWRRRARGYMAIRSILRSTWARSSTRLPRSSANARQRRGVARRASARGQSSRWRAVFADRPRSCQSDHDARARGNLRAGVADHHVRHIDDAIRICNGTRSGCRRAVCTNRLDAITRFINELRVGTVNVWEVPGYRIELTPFGGIKDSGLGYKEGVQEAMKSFTNLKTFSLPWE